jgi:diguanylate cyclase (GGDEF)-like protein
LYGVRTRHGRLAPDALTDLPNRRFVETHVARELTRAHRAGTAFAVLVIDMNDFKVISDRLGHGAGDTVLKAVAQCLRGACGRTACAGATVAARVRRRADGRRR